MSYVNKSIYLDYKNVSNLQHKYAIRALQK